MAKAAGVKIVPVSIGNLHRSVRAFTLYPHILFDFIGLIVRFRHTSGCKNYFFPSQHFSFFSSQFYFFKFHINFTTGTTSFFSSPAIFPPFHTYYCLLRHLFSQLSLRTCRHRLLASTDYILLTFSRAHLLLPFTFSSPLASPLFPLPSSSFFSS